MDRLSRFAGAIEDWESRISDSSAPLKLNKFPGDPKECVIITRLIALEDYEDADDEQWQLATCDNEVSVIFNRFEIRLALKQAAPAFTDDRIERFMVILWNYPCVALNRLTLDYEPFMSQPNLPPLIATGGPPRRVVMLEEM